MLQKGFRILTDAVTIALLSVALFLLFKPDGQLRRFWAERQLESATREAVTRLWDDLTDTSDRLYTTAAEPDIIEVSDYTCPFCRAMHAVVDSALGTGIRISYLHAPSSRPQAREAALAAICAERSGHFDAMHRHLITTEAWLTDVDWRREAVSAGVTDVDTFMICLEGSGATARLATQRALADSIGVSGTPMFVTRAGVHRGAGTLDDLLRLGSRSR